MIDDHVRQQIVDAAKLLRGYGIKLMISGHHIITSVQAGDFANDPDAFLANVEGVSKDAYLAYCQYVSAGFRCNGRTKSGRQCKNTGLVHPSITSFKSGISDRCCKHIEV